MRYPLQVGRVFRRLVVINWLAATAIVEPRSGLAGETGVALAHAEAREAMERLTEELPYVDIATVLFDRPDRFVARARPLDEAVFQRVLVETRSSRFSKEALLRLLEHPAPRVRTLAAVALFQREDPGVLPALVALAGDHSRTFDSAGCPLPMGGLGPAEVQTVGEIVSQMVAFYMKRAGFYYGIAHSREPGFKDYWAVRRDRSYCASWFAVQLERASQGTSPTRPDRVPQIRKVRERLDQLPLDDRVLTLLWLHGEAGADVLASKSELIQLCKGLGSEKLIRVLQRGIPSSDPDLQPRKSNNWPYKRMCLLILRHAGDLLRPQDAEALMACERWEQDYPRHGITDPTLTSWWAVAAATLQGPLATKGLHEAYARFPGEPNLGERATLSVALWRLGGDSETRFLKDWFYGETPERGAFPHSLASFVTAVSQCEQPSGKKMIAAIIGDSRFDRLDWQSLETILITVNGWLQKPLVAQEDIQKVWHPLGEGHFHWEQGQAEQRLPEETKNLRSALRDWREQLRGSVPDWVPQQ